MNFQKLYKYILDIVFQHSPSMVLYYTEQHACFIEINILMCVMIRIIPILLILISDLTYGDLMDAIAKADKTPWQLSL